MELDLMEARYDWIESCFLSADMTDMMIISNKMTLENTFSMEETYGEKNIFIQNWFFFKHIKLHVH